MPERKTSKVRVDASAVQGEGAWVDVRRMKWGEIKALSKRQKAIKAGGDDATDQAIQISDDLLAEHVLAWNWVDDDGAPLAQPLGNVDVIDGLTDEEFEFLADAIAGSESRRKN